MSESSDCGLLRFTRGGPEKWYARTADGEFAYGEGQGLYQWHRDGTGELIRTHYSGGDRQCSSNGELWQLGGAAGATLDAPTPTSRGLIAAFNTSSRRN